MTSKLGSVLSVCSVFSSLWLGVIGVLDLGKALGIFILSLVFLVFFGWISFYSPIAFTTAYYNSVSKIQAQLDKTHEAEGLTKKLFGVK